MSVVLNLLILFIGEKTPTRLAEMPSELLILGCLHEIFCMLTNYFWIFKKNIKKPLEIIGN